MKINRTMWYKILTASFIAIAIFGMASCVSVGQFMPLAKDETPLGNVQVNFVTKATWFTHDSINILAYIKLLEAAQQKYQVYIDIRDIQWVSGRVLDNQNKEISATGKVIMHGR